MNICFETNVHVYFGNWRFMALITKYLLMPAAARKRRETAQIVAGGCGSSAARSRPIFWAQIQTLVAGKEVYET